jgi:hypothetical protein
MLNAVPSDRDFWDSDTTIYELTSSGYFSASDKATDELERIEVDDLPAGIKFAIDKPVLMSALGGMISYLRKVI